MRLRNTLQKTAITPGRFRPTWVLTIAGGYGRSVGLGERAVMAGLLGKGLNQMFITLFSSGKKKDETSEIAETTVRLNKEALQHNED